MRKDLRHQCDNTLFPWDELDPEKAAVLRRAEIELRREIGTQSRSILLAGRILVEVKAMIEHGEFLLFVSNVLGIRERTAQNYISAYRMFGERKSEIISPLAPRAIYRLAAPSMPADEREDILKELEGPNPDIPAIETRILQKQTKPENSDAAPQLLLILQQIANLLKSALPAETFGEFCVMITHPLILESARSLSHHLQDVFGKPPAIADVGED